MEKNKGGRPPIFKDEQDLMDKFMNYLNTEGFERTEGGKRKYKYISITSFMHSIGSSRQTWYSLDEKFSYTKKNIDALCEEHINAGAMANDLDKTYSIFYQKNKAGYSDKTENVNTNVNLNVNMYEEMSDEELKAIANE